MKPCACCDYSMVWTLQDGVGQIHPYTNTQPLCLDSGDPSDPEGWISVSQVCSLFISNWPVRHLT